MTLRKTTFLLNKYDPCKLCVNQSYCRGSGCVGWEPKEELKHETINIYGEKNDT